MIIYAVCHVSELAVNFIQKSGVSSVRGVFISGLNTINDVICYVFFLTLVN